MFFLTTLDALTNWELVVWFAFCVGPLAFTWLCEHGGEQSHERR